MGQLKGLMIGLSGGFFGGMVGLGGGVVMIPLMTGFARFSQIQAHGTSLAAIVFTAVTGALSYSRYDAVDWKVAAMLAVTAMITARFGVHYAHSLPEKKLKRAFGFFLFFVSALLLAKSFVPAFGLSPGKAAQIVIFLMTGAFTGFISGMMGVGGGAIMIPAMVLAAGMAQHTAQGTALLAMVPIGIAGAWSHYRLGNVRVDILLGLVAGAFVGGYVGGFFANMLPELPLRIIFSAALVWLGTKLTRKA